MDDAKGTKLPANFVGASSNKISIVYMPVLLLQCALLCSKRSEKAKRRVGGNNQQTLQLSSEQSRDSYILKRNQTNCSLKIKEIACFLI
ncbi:unnamed protein product [Citrullus colocynthis]|uniref:Uncharacterized protein n=1 Tax=Citrullus colocynthis TaxID=252529 RepID=A0ABP0Y858_9ROSI